MATRNIILTDLSKPSELFRLTDYLRELFGLFSPRIQTVAYAADIVLDADLAETFFIILTGNVTGITIKNADSGRKIKVIFLQDGTGSRTIAGWPASVLFSGASFTITSNANRYSTISLEYINSKWIETARTTDVR